MSINFTPLNINNSLYSNKTNTNNNLNTFPNNDFIPLNNFNNSSVITDISGKKEINYKFNLNSELNQNETNSNELINSFRNSDINNINNNNNENNLIKQLKKEYDQRISSLYNNIKMVISKIENDDILASMRDDMDNNNSPFITDRIKEIIDDNFYKEKEKIIEKLTFENVNLKNNLNNLIQNNGNGKSLSLNQQLQIKRLEKVINELNINIDSYNMELNNKNIELNNLQNKYNIINNELIKIKKENSSFYDSFGNCDNQLEICKKNLYDANKEIDRLNKVINVMEIDLK